MKKCHMHFLLCEGCRAYAIPEERDRDGGWGNDAKAKGFAAFLEADRLCASGRLRENKRE